MLGKTRSGSPVVSAGTAVAVAAGELGISITKKEVAELLHISPAAIPNREEIWRKQGRISLLSDSLKLVEATRLDLSLQS
jgi:transcription initiation factor TFIIIB Brf1 subunit/transcription initiation factor TFIIB